MIDTQEAVTKETAPGPARMAARSWPIILLAALVLLLYRVVLLKLIHDWWNFPDFSHGFVVPVFSAFLVYRDRARLAQTPKKPTWLGLIVVAMGLAWLVVGVLGAELFLSRTSGIVLLAGIALTFWGWPRLRVLAFPLAFLVFAIPIPAIVFNQITFPLQLLASRVAAEILPLLQVPVLREGNVIRLPAMSLEVAEACSGIRSLMSLGTLAIIYGFFLEKAVWKRVALALASVPIAVFANSARIIGTGLCVQYWDPTKALGFFHEFSGFVIFGFSLAMLFAVQKGLALVGKKKEPSSSGTHDLPSPANPAIADNGNAGIRFVVIVIVLVAATVFLRFRGVMENIPQATPLAAFPAVIGPWQSVDRPIDSDVREILGPGDFLNRFYVSQEKPVGVDLFIAYFPSQRSGDTIHSPKNCLPGAGWVFENSRHVPLQLPGMKPLQVNETILAKGPNKMFAIYWYQAHGRAIASEYWAKFYLVADAMRMNRTDGALVRLITPVLPGETVAAARARTLELAAQFSPQLKNYIPQ
jgi:exosortase D (VPLPA-CTERM-specific)